MNTVFTLVFIGSIVGIVFFAYQAEKCRKGSTSKRVNTIVSIIFLVIMIIAIIIKGKS